MNYLIFYMANSVWKLYSLIEGDHCEPDVRDDILTIYADMEADRSIEKVKIISHNLETRRLKIESVKKFVDI